MHRKEKETVPPAGEGSGGGKEEMMGRDLTSCLGIHLMLVQFSIRHLLLRVQLGIGSLLGRFALDLASGDVRGAQSFQFHLGSLRLDDALQFGIVRFGFALSFDSGEVEAHAQLRLARRQLRIRRRLFALALRLQHRRLGVDLAHFLLRLALFLRLADVTPHSRLGHVDFGLVQRALVRFAAEKGKIFAAGCILKFFDVCVVSGKRQISSVHRAGASQIDGVLDQHGRRDE